MSTKCQLLLFEALMMNLRYYSSFYSRIHYYDLTDTTSHILLTKESAFNRGHDQIQIDQIWGNYVEKFFFPPDFNQI